MYIAETGWPTESDDTANAQNGANSPADLAGLQTFLDTFVCAANLLPGAEDYFFLRVHHPIILWGAQECLGVSKSSG